MINYTAAIALAVLVMPEGSRSFFFVVLHQVQYPAIVVLKEIRWKVVLNNKTYEDSGRDSMYIIVMEQEQTSAGFVLQRRASSISSTQP